MKNRRTERQRNAGTRRRGFTMVELLVVIAIIGILAAILMPVLASSRRSANRNRDLNNMKKQVDAYQAFNNDNKQRYPWHMTAKDGNAVAAWFSPGGGGAWKFEWDSLLDIRRLHQTQTFNMEIPTCKILMSPCDPGALKRNQIEASAERGGWGWEGEMDKNSPEGKANHGFKRKEIAEDAQSYSVCFGAYMEKGAKGIILLTRNHGGKNGTGYNYKYPSGVNLKYGGRRSRRGSMVDLRKTDKWMEPTVKTDNPRQFVVGLNANEGQIAFCDGSARLADDAFLKEAVKDHGLAQTGLLKVQNFNTARPRH